MNRRPYPSRNRPTARPRSRAAGWLLTALVASVLAGSVQAGELYRFKNASGGLVLSSSIPNERVTEGYEVIDSYSGRLLRTVAPQISAEEAAAKAEFERRVGVCKIALRRVQTMYESNEDIDKAETKALQSLETRIVNAQANLTHLRNQRSNFEDQAARMERSGNGVTPALMGNLERANNQIANLEKEIQHRSAEQDEARDGYALDRKIFAVEDCELAASQGEFAADDPQLADNG